MDKIYSNYLVCLIFLFCVSASAQVGIGTTTPDASSILDITSTTQGVLTPRMTTAQRTAIASPAEGLLVYDTDEDAFYYYDGTSASWDKVEGSFTRDNHKLIKSAADLADELVAGGGTEYLLNTNYLYEVNGTITLAVPINLNGAYIIGEDSYEDILVRVGGTMFTGSTSGSIRNLTLTAPGGTIFNLTGTGAESLLIRDTVVANSNSVGSVTDYDLFFLSIVQFVNNTGGITYNGINQLLLNSGGWDGTNGGTYETFVGNFEVITKQGGFSEVIGATAAIDVTGVGTISGAATIRNVDFFGGGNYINGTSPYTGYNFTNIWDVSCPGIPVEVDGAASANFYYNGSLTVGFTQTIPDGTAVEVQGGGTFVANDLFRFTSGGGNNRMIYDGIKERIFNINASLSVRVTNAAGDFYAFLVAKNGTLLTESNAVVYIDNDSQIQNVAINANTSLANGDYIEVYVQRLTGGGSDTLAVFSENLSIK